MTRGVRYRGSASATERRKAKAMSTSRHWTENLPPEEALLACTYLHAVAADRYVRRAMLTLEEIIDARRDPWELGDVLVLCGKAAREIYKIKDHVRVEDDGEE